MNPIAPKPRRRQRQLTLLRQGQRLSPAEYNALPRSERLALIRQAHGRQQLDLILGAADGAELVPKLASQELYLLLREVGPAETADLLTLITSGQLTTLLDLDIWADDDLDLARLRTWLQMLLEAGPETVCRTARELEPELLILIFSRFVRVLRGLEVYDDDDAENAGRLEGVYDLEYLDPGSMPVVAQILEILYREETAVYLWLMEAVRAETPTVLLEEEYQFRRGRLLDHGFADPAEALGIYAYIDPHTFDPTRHPRRRVEAPEEGAVPPGYLMAADNPPDLLAEVLAGGMDDATAWEFSLLLNRVLAADRTDVGDKAAVAQTLRRMRQLLNLGLEHLAEGQSERATELFRQLYLQDLFRVGFSLTLELRHWAVNLLQAPFAARLDRPYRRLLEALDRPLPQFYQGFDRPPQDSERDFATRQDLRTMTRKLEEIEAQKHLFDGALPFTLETVAQLNLDGCQPFRAEALNLSTLLLTALANKLLDGDFLPEPLPAARLRELHAIVATDGWLDPALREGTTVWLEELIPDAGAFGHFCLDRWQEEFCQLRPEALDPRFIGGLIVRMEDWKEGEGE